MTNREKLEQGRLDLTDQRSQIGGDDEHLEILFYDFATFYFFCSNSDHFLTFLHF